MPKKPNRRLRLLVLLQAGQSDMEALRSDLQVSERQVFRYIEELRSSGYVIYTDPNSHRYKIQGPAALPDVQFDVDEVLALVTLCNNIGSRDGIPFMQSARRAAIKLQNMLPSEIVEKIKWTASDLVIIPQKRNPMNEAHNSFEIIREAIQAKKSIRISYIGPLEPEFQTLLSPYNLVFCMRSWYVIGRSSLHRETRTFNLGRITRYEQTDSEYAIPKGFTLKQYFGNAWRLIREPGPDQQVSIWFSPLVAKNVSEVLWHPTQRILHNSDGSIEFHATVSGLREIAWWILGYGKEAEALKPTKLREIIREHTKTMFEKYTE